MKMVKPEDLRQSEQVDLDLFEFQFDLMRASGDYSWIRLDPPSNFEVLAGEASGDVYLSYGPGAPERRPVLYVTSEGAAGKIGDNLAECLTILLALPYWHDLLKFSGRGNLAEMRKTAQIIERRRGTELNLYEEPRRRLQIALGLTQIADPVAALHKAIASTDCAVVAAGGSKYESLFGRFTSDDNPNL